MMVTLRRLGIRGCVKKLIGIFISGAKQVPGLSGVVQNELKKEVDSLEKSLLGNGDSKANIRLPATGVFVFSFYH
jgi:hypothetical protein